MRGLMIVNACHRCRTPRRDLEALARRLGCELSETACPAEARDLTLQAVREHAEFVMAVGGDGTANELCNVLAGTATALALFPVGTANDLATHFRTRAACWRPVCQLSDLRPRHMDLVRVNGWYFATVGGFGVPVAVLHRMAEVRRGRGALATFVRRVGAWGYLAALGTELRQMSRSHGEAEIVADGKRTSAVFSSVFVANQSTLGHLFCASPESRNDDGRCEVALLPPSRGLASACVTVGSMLLRSAHHSGMIRLCATRLEISCDRPVVFFGDGEVRPPATDFRVEVAPGALKVLCPPAPAAFRQPELGPMSSRVPSDRLATPVRSATPVAFSGPEPPIGSRRTGSGAWPRTVPVAPATQR
jgi:diacylglycerol kinase (ATP)